MVPIIPESYRSPAAEDPFGWDEGCAHDAVRNEVVIPHLHAVLAEREARDVVDIGCGTGYVSRVLASEPGRHWILLDHVEELLAFSAERMPAGSSFTTLLMDVTNGAHTPGLAADVAFAAFTFMELVIDDVVAGNCRTLLRPGGTLVLYLPDVLTDIAHSGDGVVLPSYTSGHCELEKQDHFTGLPLHFHANRIEHVLTTFLDNGFTLCCFERKTRPDRTEDVFCLRFTAV